MWWMINSVAEELEEYTQALALSNEDLKDFYQKYLYHAETKISDECIGATYNLQLNGKLFDFSIR